MGGTVGRWEWQHERQRRRDRRRRREAPGGRRGLRAAIGDVVGALLTPTGLAGAALEATWMGLHLGLYPLGLLGPRATDRRRGYRLEHLPPSQRGLAIHNVEAAETPILLVHGMVDNRSIFTVLRRGLVRRGFGQIETINYSILTDDIRSAAARLGAEVERIVEETGYERIHVIGHSMGGLIARYYVTRLGGDAHVHTLVTLGTPHRGSYLAYSWNNGLTRQLRPGSALMEELAGPVTDCQTRFIVYWSDLDQVVVPQRNAALHHEDLNVHNIALHGVGHMSSADHRQRRPRHLGRARPPRHRGSHGHPGVSALRRKGPDLRDFA